nr:immunoglobulin light chain junction region [Macaca mulatta]
DYYCSSYAGTYTLLF